MLRCLFVLLTVFSVLACPLTCMGGAAAGATRAEPSAEACPCCCHPACEGGTDSPLPDGPCFPGDECANCVCRGALVTKNGLNIGTEAAARALALQADLPFDVPVAAFQSPVPAVDASPPDVRSGR